MLTNLMKRVHKMYVTISIYFINLFELHLIDNHILTKTQKLGRIDRG